jgi:mRNA-degrading endonuclease RelE of RelBE toxin-antitoxin system
LVYSIRIGKKAAKALKKLDLETRRRVVSAIRSLANRSSTNRKQEDEES